VLSQRPYRHSRTEPVFVGFAGRIGAGKTSAAQYLSSKYGFGYIRYSAVLQDWLSAEGCDRERLQQLGWDVMSGGLQVELNTRLIAGINRLESTVIDGLRHQIDFDLLSTTFGASFGLIFLEAGEEARFQRVRSRFPTYAAFRAADSQPVEAHIDSLKSSASTTLSSDEPLERLYQHLDMWVAANGFGDQR